MERSIQQGSTDFDLAGALADLVTRRHAYSLTCAEAPGLSLALRIEPLGDAELGGRWVKGYRRTVQTWRDAHLASEVSAISHVDLRTGRFVGNTGAGMVALVRHAHPLPATARVGDAGPLFESVVQPVPTQSGAAIVTAVSWSLERWKDGRIWWCLRVAPSSDGAIESVEAYAIDPSGRIEGAAIQARIAAAQGSAGGPQAHASTEALAEPRLVTWLSPMPAAPGA